MGTVITTETTGSYLTGLPPHRHHYFWRSVVAGTTVAIAISVLSSALMFAVKVTHYDRTGVLALGWGAAIWLAITACIAFYVGGVVASALAVRRDTEWLRGLSVWALSIPVSMVLSSVLAMGSYPYGVTERRRTWATRWTSVMPSPITGRT